MLLASGSGDEAEFFAQLDGLGAALSAQFVKDATGVSLYGVFAHEELFRDLPVAETLGDEFQYFQFARRDAEGFAFAVVGAKGFAGRNGDFLCDNALLLPGQLQAKPDAESGKCRCNQASIDFDGVLGDEEAVLRPFQRGDEDASDQTVEDDMAFHRLRLGSVWREFYYGMVRLRCWDRTAVFNPFDVSLAVSSQSKWSYQNDLQWLLTPTTYFRNIPLHLRLPTQPSNFARFLCGEIQVLRPSCAESLR